jgi:signal transduction histidine kinase
MSSDKVPFIKSIRFKITLLYSLITFVVSALAVLSLNISINNYFVSTFHDYEPKGPNGFMAKLNEEKRELLNEARLIDIREIQQRSINSLFPLAIFSFLVGYVLSGSFTRPLIKMQKKIDKLTDQDLGLQLDDRGEDEIAMLSYSFNKMSLRLKDAFDTQIRFVQDASHEIKTPLAIIQANLEDSLDSKKITDEDALEGISNAVQGVKRLSVLTESLLDISNQAELNLQEIDLTKVIKEQIKTLEKKAKKQKVSLKFDYEDEVLIQADKNALAQMIFNIIENAIKYSNKENSSKSFVEVSIEKTENIKLVIKDNGIGIPEDKLMRVFERFYQVDEARCFDNEGSGLGLSIVKSIVDKHYWNLELESSEDGSQFTITFN